MATRSTQFAWALTGAGTTTLFTVPTGHRYLLKNGYVESGATTGGTWKAYLQNAANTRQALLSSLTTAGAVLTSSWAGWAVLNAGDKLIVIQGGTATNWYSFWSGADLLVP